MCLINVAFGNTNNYLMLYTEILPLFTHTVIFKKSVTNIFIYGIMF